MLAIRVPLLAGLCAAAVLQDTGEMHFFTKIRRNENCEICYGYDCFTIDETRCDYYRQTENVLWGGPENIESEESEIKHTIDGYLIEYVHEGPWTETECIPFISQYTNCNRENICTGCQTCNCDGVGRWNCTMMQRCVPDDIMDVNHRTLVVVMEKLKDYMNIYRGKKSKRSIINDDETKKETMTHEDILKLLYGIENFENNNQIKPIEKIVTQNNTSKGVNDVDYNIWDTESLSFEELLNSVYHDRNINFNLNDMAQAAVTVLQNKSDVVNISDTNIKDLNNNRKNKDNDIVYVKSVEVPTFDFLNYFDETVNRNLKKREITSSTKQVKNNVSMISDNNSSTNMKELRNNVLYPMFNIVNEKQRELDQLINIKDKLVVYFKSFTDVNITNNATNGSAINDNTHLYFYQLEIPTENPRKHNQNVLEKYLQKLKRDLFEVTRDITNIQRLSNSSTMPHDLKVLMKAIKYYVTKEKQGLVRGKVKQTNNVNFRRRLDMKSNSKQSHSVNKIIKIFEILDKNVPVAKALEPVSLGAKLILKRIIDQFYVDDYAGTNSKVFDSQYDITDVLIGIGSGWDKVTASIIHSQLSNRLYCMKLLQLEVTADMKKIRLALELLQFSENRRVLLIGESIGQNIISKIGDDLQRINHRVKQMIQLQALNSDVQKTKAEMLRIRSQSGISTNKENKKRKSFFQTIKTLLRNSKKDIRDLLHKNVPKSDIIKHIAKKKLDEMTKKKLSEYEETMERRQDNFNLRNKRSPGEIDSFFSRLKNIIPEYLRAMVPARFKNEKSKQHTKKKRNNTKVVRKRILQGSKTNKITKLPSTTPINKHR